MSGDRFMPPSGEIKLLHPDLFEVPTAVDPFRPTKTLDEFEEDTHPDAGLDGAYKRLQERE
jgi:hypothetical protein